jgi:hypothetical protein
MYFEHYRKVATLNSLYNNIIFCFLKYVMFTFSELPSISLFLYYTFNLLGFNFISFYFVFKKKQNLSLKDDNTVAHKY